MLIADPKRHQQSSRQQDGVVVSEFHAKECIREFANFANFVVTVYSVPLLRRAYCGD